MRTLIYGAGAIGGYVGGLMAKAGNDVTLLARGAHAAALERDGLAIEWHDGRHLHVRPSVALPGAAIGKFNKIFVTLKSRPSSACAAVAPRQISTSGLTSAISRSSHGTHAAISRDDGFL